MVSEAREHMSRLVSCGSTAVGDMVTTSGRAFSDARESFGSSCRRLLQTLGSWLGTLVACTLCVAVSFFLFISSDLRLRHTTC